MNFKDLVLQQEYNSLEEDVIRDFFIPTLSCSNKYDRAAGFFSSSGLAKQTQGICEFVKNGGKIRLIASPQLSEEDIKAIDEGYKLRDEVVRNVLLRSLKEPVDEMESQRLNLLSNLIATDILDIKIAVLKTESGIFHDKFGVMTDADGDEVAFRGSMNESENAYYHNYETIDVYTSWKEYDRVESKKEAFEKLWNGEDNTVETLYFPDVKNEIISTYRKNTSIDTELDNKQFGKIRRPSNVKEWYVSIPSRVKIREYQSEAIDKWETNSFRGIYDMATGTGKTYTALASLERFEKRKGDIFAIVVCPYIHLVDQWAEDVEDWGMSPIVCHSQSEEKDWRKRLLNAYRRYRSTHKSCICLVTNDTFVSAEFQEIVTNISSDMNAVLVVDEAHNFGASKISLILPHNIPYRLGLSATVERFGDPEGTKAILQYFGEKCIHYPLEKAIQENALVQYEYYPIVVSLSKEELQEYEKLTKQIIKCITEENGKKKISDTGQMLLFKRTRLVAGAEEKVSVLAEKMEPYKEEKHILVYCGATKGFERYKGEKERQIDVVERMIGNELHMSTHRFTAEEDNKTRRLIKEGFADGDYQVVTAIKCLDEGVNIPNIHTAFILASSRNPKEFIQRRGRVLRPSDGKERAVIYDFVTLPRPLNEVRFGDIDSDKALVVGELARIYEFGRFSVNSSNAIELIEEIKSTYNLNILNEELEFNMEVEYGEG
ncbi:DEAD/DEAH box helicase family protein [Pseudobutyrivibrio xylanivorans]|uniref:Superfamily II DNA or RNA helicase n=1 Tax=Pseudobutyrivibrio xylanivorans DSM 14809 TaxID=1123012 RepID=A0A1M6JVV7_PSEXY|nr:DEAD/DEAH box helicase family protein [Pseudobutyrivibrio xylanivorans]SHJ50816.1 Superfamily II DNA or RNA helicase [Pseudobutyrivibrio xylanivorans DSM 14809]